MSDKRRQYVIRELRVYTENIGDNCLVTDLNGKVVGAVWTGIMNDYGM